ncbi:MAG TPA: hypothetical protein VK470_17210, partial [Bacteroidota bacterium]|nr:hypothetical protein [Bacteroidota bacterium]
MKKRILLFFVLGVIASLCSAQPKRTDAIWARTAPAGSITIDGKMDEAVWAKAESLAVDYGQIAGIPGSGYTAETGIPKDPVHAIVKFLVSGNQLYLGFTVKDSSIGGANLSPDNFGAADAIILNVRDKSNPAARPSPPSEHLWGWIKADWMNNDVNVSAVGAGPATGPKNRYTKARFETATTVKGVTNDDSKSDTSYTVEMRINLDSLGYTTTAPQGDIIMINLAIRDIDWYWPVQDWLTFSRVWVQGPWANVSDKDHLRLHTRPDVTTTSGEAPTIKPEVIIPDGKNFASPAIDGKLTEPIWKALPGFRIKYGDNALRDTYPGTGSFRSGQYQPDVNGGKALVIDSADATVKWFFKADTLFIGIDVRDKVVQYSSNYDRWDGAIVTMTDRGKQNDLDHDLVGRKLTVQVDSAKNSPTRLQDYLPFLRDSLGGARAVLSLNPGTIVDTIGVKADSGYQIEMAITLTKMGYPPGRGDGIAFLGVDILDGDSFVQAVNSYGTRTWWFREHDGSDGPAFCYMDPSVVVTSVAQTGSDVIPTEFALLGNYPNPFNPSTSIGYTAPHAGHVMLSVYDMLGRSVSTLDLGMKTAGEHT